jgi:transposase-like protein
MRALCRLLGHKMEEIAVHRGIGTYINRHTCKRCGYTYTETKTYVW